MEYVAFGTGGFVSVLLPIIIFLIVFCKDKGNRKKDFLFFFTGILVYIVAELGMFQYALALIMKHSNSNTRIIGGFISNHPLLFSLISSLICSVYFLAVTLLFFKFISRGSYNIKNVFLYGIGYCGCEATYLIGIRCIITIVLLIKGEVSDIKPMVSEIFLSAYERIPVAVVEIVLFIILAYLIQKNKAAIGFLITCFCAFLLRFLPSFFMVFSTPQFYEIYSEKVALIIIYILLTLAAITSIITFYNLRYQFFALDCIEKKTKKAEKTKKNDCNSL